MKRFTAILASLFMLAALATPAFANDTLFPEPVTDGPATGIGILGVTSDAGNFGWSWESKDYSDGFFFGGGIAGGEGDASVGGVVFDGTIGAETFALGGGLSETTILSRQIEGGAVAGSMTRNHAAFGAGVAGFVDPDDGGGILFGSFSAFGGQGSINSSGGVEDSGWNSTGSTKGVGAQGSIGYMEGGGILLAGPDQIGDGETFYRGGQSGDPGYYVKVKGKKKNIGKIKYFPNGHPKKMSEWEFLGAEKVNGVDSEIGGARGGTVFMSGVSMSESYRFQTVEGDATTEVMGTNVGAATRVTSELFVSGYKDGCAIGCGSIRGGYLAGGVAASHTRMEYENGHADAKAFGLYVGGGQIGSTYDGSAAGYTQTSITTVDGMNGSINRSSSSMRVTSTGSWKGGFNDVD